MMSGASGYALYPNLLLCLYSLCAPKPSIFYAVIRLCIPYGGCK
jgi:hypothetical protein